MASITLEQLHAFHDMERELFTQLVVKSQRDPAESLLVMSLWLWLEDKGYPSIVQKMLTQSQPLANMIADEAVCCLRHLESRNPPAMLPPDGGLPLTACLVERDISLQMFTQNRFTAISGVKGFLKNVCALIFSDILEAVLVRPMSSLRGGPQDERPLAVPGFPHQVFGDVSIVPRLMDYRFPAGKLWSLDYQTADIPEDDRTMFLTFSRGFAVTEEEVKGLFTNIYGDCVESIIMELVLPPEQPLYARMILHSVTKVDEILNGMPIAKFVINGKHIWARKYEKRDTPS